MSSWIRNLDRPMIESELEKLVEENNLLREKIRLLEDRILFLKEIEDKFKGAISNELGK